MAGLTSQGFEPRRLAEIKERAEQRLRERFGDVDLSPESPFGQLVGLSAEVFAELWDEMAAVYASQYPSSAGGVPLNLAVDLNGIARQSAASTTVRAVSVGDNGLVLAAGSLAENSTTGERYQVVDDTEITRRNAQRATIDVQTVQDSTAYTITIDSQPYTYTSGLGATRGSILAGLLAALPTTFDRELQDDGLYIEFDDTEARNLELTTNLTFVIVGSPVQFAALATGPTVLPTGALDTIVTSTVGWLSVVNLVPGSAGRDVETDSELRLRRARSVRRQSRGPLDAILAALLDTQGVIDAQMYENKTDVTDSDGLPPGWVWAIVDGGSASDIAAAMASAIAGGTGTFGAETGTVTSPVTARDFTFNFDRPVIIEPYVTVDIVSNSDFPAGGVGDIRNALIEYGQTLRIGDDLKVSRLYTPINQTPGFFVENIFIGTAPGPTGSDNLPAARDDKFVLSAERIIINRL